MELIKVKVKWDFSDSYLENLQYGEALEISGLKSKYVLKVEDPEEFDVEDYLFELGSGILVESWEINEG